MSDKSLIQLLAFIDRYPRLVVLTGAGCSTASGIPDYRDEYGEWKLRQPVQSQDFINHLNARQRYWARSLLGWPRFAQAQPNAAHTALAELEHAGFVRQLITQNVDRLHQRAGSRQVIDLHGRLDTVSCLSCSFATLRQRVQQQLERDNPLFAGLVAAPGPDGDAQLATADFSRFRVPDCPRCQGILKPDVVFFGENVPSQRTTAALRSLDTADALLIVGSSVMVYSGYRLCRAAIANGQPVAAINIGRTRADNELTLKLSVPCHELLPALSARLRPGAAPLRM